MSAPDRMNYRTRKGEGREERGGSVVAQEKMCADLLEALVVDVGAGPLGDLISRETCGRGLVSVNAAFWRFWGI